MKVDEPRVTLGINIVPAYGSWSGQVHYMVKKLNEWVSPLKSGHFQQIDKWYALNQTIMTTSEYRPMVAIPVTRAQRNEIMKLLLQAILPCIGIPRISRQNYLCLTQPEQPRCDSPTRQLKPVETTDTTTAWKLATSKRPTHQCFLRTKTVRNRLPRDAYYVSLSPYTDS
jgi:hypothetical protein